MCANAQVTALKYMIKYNKETNQIDCYIIITEGRASTMKQRVQFNSQVSFVLPTGIELEIIKTYMPLNDNQNYTGNAPCKWKIMSKIMSPEVSPDYDYYSVVPDLTISSFYNNINVGDHIKLFSIGATDTNVACLKAIRLFENNVDPGSSSNGMGGSDFTNSFTLGSLQSIYTGNINSEKPNKIFQKGNSITTNANEKLYDWYSAKDNILLAQTKEPIYTPATSGKYFLKSTYEGCRIISEIVDFKAKKGK